MKASRAEGCSAGSQVVLGERPKWLLLREMMLSADRVGSRGHGTPLVQTTQSHTHCLSLSVSFCLVGDDEE